MRFRLRGKPKFELEENAKESFQIRLGHCRPKVMSEEMKACGIWRLTAGGGNHKARADQSDSAPHRKDGDQGEL